VNTVSANPSQDEQAAIVLNAVDVLAGHAQALYDNFVELAMDGGADDLPVDQWWLGIARVNLQTAFLALRNSVNGRSGF
jgi:hypothetical protein